MLDDKEFWDKLMQESNAPQEDCGTDDGVTLDHGHITQNKPTTTDPPEERYLDIMMNFTIVTFALTIRY